ncbi:MAG: WD40 repeat domain-containing protein [Microcoleaceae cyanobacterium]
MQSQGHGISFRDNTVVTGDVVGGIKYDIKFYAFATPSAAGEINWSQYRIQPQATAPYKFLSYYNTTDADIFFGRETISQFLTLTISTHKLVLINGKSGSGKTSLINAGMIPRLVQYGYFTMVFRDYGYPTETIKSGLATLENVHIDLRDCNTLLDCIQATIQQTGRPIAIFLDQFERFFINLSPEKRSQFIEELRDCLNAMNPQDMNIVISLREDFYGRLGEFWKAIPDFNADSYHQYLEPLNSTEATAAIKEPLKQFMPNLGYEPQFLQECLVPALSQRDSQETFEHIEPVHLQIVCNQLFDAARTRYHAELERGDFVLITQELYNELGGVEGILKGYVEVILNQHYSREQQDTVKAVLKQMVTAQGTRVLKSIQEIAENLGMVEDQVEAIMEQLDQSRLVETISGQKQYSITHDYLAKQINQWYTLGELELKRAKELYERCLVNWNLSKRHRIPRNQLKFLNKYRAALLKWKPEGERLFRESMWLYHGFNSAIIFGLSTLLGVTAIALLNEREAKLNAAGAAIRAAEALHNAGDRQPETLVELLRAKKILRHSFLLSPGLVEEKPQGHLAAAAYGLLSAAWRPDPAFKHWITETLVEALDSTQERHRLWHEDEIWSAEFSPDGNKIVTASSDGTAKLWNAQGELIKSLVDHEARVNSAEFSPDGEKIVTASFDYTAIIWNAEGRQLTTLRGHSDQVWTAEFSPDGERIVTGSDDQTAKVWSIQGKLLATLDGHTDVVTAVEFSPDSQQIATASKDGMAKVWTQGGKLLATLKGHQQEIYSIKFSPDGQFLVTASKDRTAKVWTLQGQLLATLKGHTDWVGGAQFSPDGQSILTTSWDKTARLWNVKGQQLVVFKGHQDIVRSAQFSNDGQSLVTAALDNTAKVWTLQGELFTTLKGHTNVVTSAKFGLGDQFILTASSDRTARVWNLGGELLPTLRDHRESVWTAQFSADGQSVVTASSDQTAKLWSIEGELLATLEHDGEVESAQFSPDGQRIVTTSLDRTARVWNLQGNLLATLKGHDDEVESAQFSPEGQRIITTSLDETAKLWDNNGKLLATLSGHGGEVWRAQFDPDGKQIVTTSSDKTAKLWNLQGELLTTLEGHESTVWSAQFSPDGQKIVTSSWDETARIWNLEGELLATLGCEAGHNGWVWSAQFSPDGQKIVTASDDKTAKVWDVSGELLLTLAGHKSKIGQVHGHHEGSVWNAEFSPDGQKIVTASDDGTAMVWNLAGELLTTLKGHRESVWSAQFSPDSQSIVTASYDKTAKVWRLLALERLTSEACARVSGYLKDYPDVDEGDRQLCDNVPSPEEL